ncbi:hypothetical protein [Caulobacter sp. S45]|uniref:hypothetical protein n=1 Tax=Caulobacter sp. S45 TaxID=1641861 RepID=UPI001575E01E|nr:hypothetical protein [Caulobacter sp. S45]
MSALAQVQTLFEHDRSAQLAAIARSGACEAGRVIMLDFSLVREKVGARWSARCEAIWDHTERTIRRHLLSTGIFCRVNQTNYVISFADMDGFGAQGLGFRIMEDVITHFLGSCSPKDMLVKTVSELSESEIIASPVAFRDEHLTHGPDPTGSARPVRRPTSLPPLVHVIEDQLQQSFAFEHVFNLKLDKPVALRVSSSLMEPITRRPLKPAEQAALTTRLLLKADLNTFEMLDHLIAEMPPKLIIAPLSMQTLTATKSRSALLTFLNKLDSQAKSRLIVEIYGLEDGTPASRLTETTTLLKPFCRTVMARITSSRSSISNVRTARLPAVSTCALDAGASPAKLAANLLAVGEAARGIAPMLMVSDLPDVMFLSVCTVAGFSHAAVTSRSLRSEGLEFG